MNYKIIIGVLVAVVIALVAYKETNHSNGLLGSTACSGITCLSGGLRLVSDAGGDFETDIAAVINSTLNVTGLTTLAGVNASGAATIGGTLTVTTTNAATSTTKVGCLQLVATSTGNPIKLVFMATSTYSNGTALAQTGSSVTPSGIVLFATGNCP